jgi:sulfatase maturation enzyme AslB (radical SAM superfamily)
LEAPPIRQYQGQDPDAILHDPQRNALHQRVEKLQKTEYGGYGYREPCHSGCPLDAYWKHKDFMHKSEWCSAKPAFIERYFEPITGFHFESLENGIHRDAF